MKDLAALLQAISTLLWPILTFVALLMFRKQIADIVSRLKRGKLFGQEIELDESLNKLRASTDLVQQEVAALPAIETHEKTVEEVTANQDVAQQIISEAAKSPKAALISLSSELEKLAREILATTGHLQGRRHVAMPQAISELHKTHGLASHVPSSLHHFWDVRNRVIHLGEGNDEDILRALDSGIALLRALQAVPRETNIVSNPRVQIYADPELESPIEGIHGVFLESRSPGGVSTFYRVFPTTRNDYVAGKSVTWEWNMSRVTGPAWYRNPATGAAEPAWSSSAEFVGRHVDELK